MNTQADRPSDSAAEPMRVPPLAGRRVVLRPLVQPHYPWLYELAVSEQVGFRWRFRGSTPSQERFMDSLWRQTLAQFVVTRADNGQPIGLVQCYSADLRNPHAYLSVLFDHEYRRAGWPMEGVLLFVNYLFGHWDFQKLYLEVLSFNLDQFASAIGTFLAEEGVLRSHERFMGGFADLHVLALHRDAWDASGAAALVDAVHAGS